MWRCWRWLRSEGDKEPSDARHQAAPGASVISVEAGLPGRWCQLLAHPVKAAPPSRTQSSPYCHISLSWAM